MQTVENIFYKEFNKMMQQRKGYSGLLDLKNIPIPDECIGSVEKYDHIMVKGVEEEYYKKLNDHEGLLWPNEALSRRTYDSKGEYIKDKDENFVTEDVVLPHSCCALLMKEQIGVLTSFQSKELFEYVDVLHKVVNGEVVVWYIYIIPRKYCFEINQTALVMSTTKLRTFYDGISLALTSGHNLFLFVIPYKATQKQRSLYKVLQCGKGVTFDTFVEKLENYWINMGVIFDPKLCGLTEYIGGKENVAYTLLEPSLDPLDYVLYSESKTLDGEVDLTNLSDVEVL